MSMDWTEAIEKADGWDEQVEKTDECLRMEVFPKIERLILRGKSEAPEGCNWEELWRDFILLRDRWENEMHMRRMDRQPFVHYDPL